MNTETEAEQTVTKPLQSKKKPKKRSRLVLLFLILLLACTFLLSYPLWQKFTSSQLALQEQVQGLQTDLQALQSQNNQTSLDALQTRFDGLEKNVATLTHQIDLIPHNDDDWKLAEINYLLKIAHHRLQLAQDVSGALAALITADKRLQNLNKPSLFHVRELVLQYIKRLRELKRPDIAGIAMRLAQYAAQADNLPLLQEHRKTHTQPLLPEETTSSEQQSWQEQIWTELKQLVVIRYNSEADSGFLTAGQGALVAQILSLKLESARFSLLRLDTQNFVASIQAVRDWLKRYYDQNDQKVSALQKDLVDMQKIILDAPLPDISSLLKLLQRFSISSNQTVGVPSAAQGSIAK